MTDCPSPQNGEQRDAVQSFMDSFSEPCAAGRVVGSYVKNGPMRRGVDKERVVSIDNGALRIEPLVWARWGRAGIAYGPYERLPGLAFGVSILNGHNTSQSGPLPEGLKLRLRRWALGSETEDVWTRLRRWSRSRQRRYMWRRLLHWAISGSRYLQTTTVDENLAVGWFPDAEPTDPVHRGNALVMHALGPECGELWARVGSTSLRAVRGVQNVHMYHLVVLRARGAAYYVASVRGVPGLSPYPMMRPIAIDATATESRLFAGVHQSVLGQIGFRVDTRVYRTQVEHLPAYAEWYGSAIGADNLQGGGPLEGSEAQVGGCWTVWEGGAVRSERGLRAGSVKTIAALRLDVAAGLVHAIVETDGAATDGVSLVFRASDSENYWAFELGTSQSTLILKESGVLSCFPSTRDFCLIRNQPNSVQVLDDGESIRLFLNGDLVYGTHFTDRRLSGGRMVGFALPAQSGGLVLRDFEAHPRELPLPAPFELGQPWQPEGQVRVASDDFTGAEQDLSGRTTPHGGLRWRRAVGRGAIRLTGDGAARVQATLKEPCPGRTAYTLPWRNPTFADLRVEITPPGVRRGSGERGRGGLIFRQDDRNYISFSVFVDDWYGTSIAAFFYRDGFEELYDAIWTNIGRRVHWGVPYSFRAVFDANHYMTYVNDEPVMQRALCDVYPDWRDLLINEVGIVANWEWGSDTGTRFRDFVAKDR